MINNVVLVSCIQQSDSVIHTHVSILFQILFLLFLSLISGLVKPVTSLPICRTMVQEVHHSHRNLQGKSGKGYQIAEVGHSWKQSSVKGQ